MKRSLVLLLALVMLFCLTACGGDKVNTPTGENTGATTNIPESTNNPTNGTQDSIQETADTTFGEGNDSSTETTKPSVGNTETTPPAHIHEYIDKLTAATCTNEGYTLHTCSCGDSYSDNKIAAVGHNFGEWNTTKEPTTTATGAAERKCLKCDETETKVLGKLIDNHKHSYQKWVTTIIQTFDAEGLQERTCNVCGRVETRAIPTSQPTAISIENNTITIYENEVKTLRPVLTPAGSKTKYTFSSSNSNVVNVASAGGNTSCNITGVSAGTATITITTEFGLTVSCKIIVKGAPQPTAIVIPENISLKTGAVYHIPINLQPFDSKTLFTVSTSDASVVLVNTTGGRSGVCITGISSGAADIVIRSSNGLSVTSHIIVE